MANRLNKFYINPAFHSDIFNTSMDTQPSQVSVREPVKQNHSARSQEKSAYINKNDTSIREDSYYRLKTWDARDRSLDDSRYGGSVERDSFRKDFTERSLVEESRKQDQVIKKSEIPKKAAEKKPEALINRDKNVDRHELYKIQLEIAQYKKNQYMSRQNNYKKELEKQIQDKQSKKKIERITDLHSKLSGLPIGEIHGGFDVDECAKIMRIRQNKKLLGKSMERTGRETERADSLNSSRDSDRLSQSFTNQPMRAKSTAKLLDVSYFCKVEEESDSQSQGGSPHCSRRKTLGVPSARETNEKKGKDYSEYLHNPTGSRYHIEKVHHQKLRESILTQIKKLENYTSKVLDDQKKRKQVVKKEITAQATSDFQRKRTLLHQEKARDKSLEGFKIGNSKRIETPAQAKEALLTIASKYRCKIEDKPAKSKEKRRPEREGLYQRLVNDSVKQILSRKSKQSQPNQKANNLSFGVKN